MFDDKTGDRPATFREVFASHEFRAVYASSLLSWLGDNLARVAVTALVYHRTGSVSAAALSFALSYLPWIAGGPLLAAMAERYPHRTVMIICDLARGALVGLVAAPAMPVPGMLVLLFLASLLSPPFNAARSAQMPRILSGDRYVVGLALHNTTGQAAQVFGYAIGGAFAPFHPRLALLIDAATFGLSACLIGLGVRRRQPGLNAEHRSHLLRETAEGFQLVFGHRVLRAVAVVVFSAMLFSIVPEGLAAAWSAQLTPNLGDQGMVQSLIMLSNPVGWVVGGLIVGRLLGPVRRQRLLRPFAILAPLTLTPALFDPPALVIGIMAFACGFCVAGTLPVSNALFVQALPDAFRARAFGVMQTGVQVIQGVAVLITGFLADHFRLPIVVGLWSVAGVVIMIIASTVWPSRERFAEAARAAREANEEAAARDRAAESARAYDASRMGRSEHAPRARGNGVPAQPVHDAGPVPPAQAGPAAAGHRALA